MPEGQVAAPKEVPDHGDEGGDERLALADQERTRTEAEVERVKTTTLTTSGGRFTRKKRPNSRLPRAEPRALNVQYLFQTKLLQMPST